MCCQRKTDPSIDEIINDASLRLDGSKVFMRKLSSEDCGNRYLGWLNDPEVNRFSGRAPECSREQMLEYLEKMNAPGSNHLLMGIFWKENEEHIGNCLLGPIDKRNANAEISNLIGEKSFWGKGVAVEADRLIINFAFSKLRLHKITIGNIAPNRGATFMSRQLGFSLEATLKEQILWNGTFVDVLRFGLLREQADKEI